MFALLCVFLYIFLTICRTRKSYFRFCILYFYTLVFLYFCTFVLLYSCTFVLVLLIVHITRAKTDGCITAMLMSDLSKNTARHQARVQISVVNQPDLKAILKYGLLVICHRFYGVTTLPGVI